MSNTMTRLVLQLVLVASGAYVSWLHVRADCFLPAESLVEVATGKGKICCPSGITREPGQEDEECLGGDTHACWFFVDYEAPYYAECIIPSEEFKCIDRPRYCEKWVIWSCSHSFPDPITCFYTWIEEVEVSGGAKEVRMCEGGGTSPDTDEWNTIYTSQPDYNPSNNVIAPPPFP